VILVPLLCVVVDEVLMTQDAPSGEVERHVATQDDIIGASNGDTEQPGHVLVAAFSAGRKAQAGASGKVTFTAAGAALSVSQHQHVRRSGIHPALRYHGRGVSARPSCVVGRRQGLCPELAQQPFVLASFLLGSLLCSSSRS
jgi:hypothetical protein